MNLLQRGHGHWLPALWGSVCATAAEPSPCDKPAGLGCLRPFLSGLCRNNLLTPGLEDGKGSARVEQEGKTGSVELREWAMNAVIPAKLQG